jgi:hypothetical protein
MSVAYKPMSYSLSLRSITFWNRETWIFPINHGGVSGGIVQSRRWLPTSGVILKVIREGCSETSVNDYEITWWREPENHTHNFHSRENLKTHIWITSLVTIMDLKVYRIRHFVKPIFRRLRKTSLKGETVHLDLHIPHKFRVKPKKIFYILSKYSREPCSINIQDTNDPG